MRVIAGSLGGLRIEAPKGRATRPTSDRVREALFSILTDVAGARVLDLYAGTGALGIEALSRGARAATFVENGRDALRVLRANLRALRLEGAAHVVADSAARAVRAVSGPFDLVFADPPYAAVAEAAVAVAVLTARGVLAAQATIVVEHASRDPAPNVVGLLPRPTRTYGDTSVTLYDLAPAPLSERPDSQRPFGDDPS